MGPEPVGLGAGNAFKALSFINVVVAGAGHPVEHFYQRADGIKQGGTLFRGIYRIPVCDHDQRRALHLLDVDGRAVVHDFPDGQEGGARPSPESACDGAQKIPGIPGRSSRGEC